MLTLFVNPIGKSIQLSIIDTKKRTVIESKSIEKTGNDFEIIPGIFVEGIKKYQTEEIWCIVGPGSFTLLRIITLILNSIAYHSPHIHLKSYHYFDLIDTSVGRPILEANRHEYLIRTEDGEDVIIKKESLPPGKYTGYIDETDIHSYTPFKPTIQYIIDCFTGIAPIQRLSPIYIKSPNITLGSKKTSLPRS